MDYVGNTNADVYGAVHFHQLHDVVQVKYRLSHRKYRVSHRKLNTFKTK
jgi:hypothetical protein